MKYKFLVLLILAGTMAFGQELKINVTVSAPKLKLAEPRVFKTMERSIQEFFNNNKWTDLEFESEESIEGNLQITISEEFSASSFSADIIFQCIRPVYNSNYTTPVFTYVDESLNIKYEELQAIEISNGVYIDDLSSLLSFYAYMIIGIDFDSFSSLGGETYFQLAENVLNAVPSSSINAKTWEARADKKENRYWLLENLINPKYRPYRQSMYEYHRMGLDVMADDVDRGKAVMVSALKEMDKVNQSYPYSIFLRGFLDSKRDEIIQIFKGGSRGQKNTVYNLMSRMDPSQASSYAEIRK
jgi:hypothetical protein